MKTALASKELEWRQERLAGIVRWENENRYDCFIYPQEIEHLLEMSRSPERSRVLEVI